VWLAQVQNEPGKTTTFRYITHRGGKKAASRKSKVASRKTTNGAGRARNGRKVREVKEGWKTVENLSSTYKGGKVEIVNQ
jgi:hypothetical protein